MTSVINYIKGVSMRGFICFTAVCSITFLSYNRVDNPVAYTTLAGVIGGYFGNLMPKGLEGSDTNQLDPRKPE